MAFTAFLGAAFLTGMIWLEQPNLKTGMAFGAATGLAMVSKFSTFAFFPAGILALACYLIAGRFDWNRISQAVRPRAASFGSAVAVACLVVWAAYRFSFGAPGGHGIPVPAPELFQGIRDVAEHNQHGHPGYLLGAYSRFGFWYFYPVVLAVKTPIAFLLLLGGGAWLAIRKRAFGPIGWVPLAMAGGMLLIAAFSRINIGVRHVLPVYLFCSLVAGAALLRLPGEAAARKWVPVALLALVVWFGASSLISHPDYLAYFNEFAGSEPEKIVVDSDLDWGQDVKRLAARLREAGAGEVTFANQMLPDFRSELGLPPMVERMDVTAPNPGWNAVSLTFLKSRRLGLFEQYPNVVLWPDHIAPQERVGKGILLWYFPPAR
jgi:4-amino-4-deoxy-L-arabinose transferase-like glycosyltransferase